MFNSTGLHGVASQKTVLLFSPVFLFPEIILRKIEKHKKIRLSL
jgi:hypothetical protein